MIAIDQGGIVMPPKSQSAQLFARDQIAEVRQLLHTAGLRPTRQRLALAERLFFSEGRHVSADRLYDELVSSGAPGSLSCVYNTLRRFSEIGLLRRIPVYGNTTYFDTDLTHHHHFYVTDEDRLINVPANTIIVDAIPPPPAGYRLISVEVLLRLQRLESSPE